VNYGPGRQRYRCAVCLNYRIPRICVRVEGDISPDAVCDLFNQDRWTVTRET
jgi:hypothetical protein